MKVALGESAMEICRLTREDITGAQRKLRSEELHNFLLHRILLLQMNKGN